MDDPAPSLELLGEPGDGAPLPRNLTIGDWATEAESAAALDHRLAACDLWVVYQEVTGVLLQPRADQVNKGVRIDRVLLPRRKLSDAGWRRGAIGIEVKRSGVKIGPPLAQAMDYTRAAWLLPDRGISILLSSVFLWPMAKQFGPLASVLVHNRIGSASFNDWSLLHLKFGEETVIDVRSADEFRLGSIESGRKVGSR